MITIEVRDGLGNVIGRCDCRCWHAKGARCKCVCGGLNHGTGDRPLPDDDERALMCAVSDWADVHPNAVSCRMSKDTPCQLELPWREGL